MDSIFPCFNTIKEKESGGKIILIVMIRQPVNPKINPHLIFNKKVKIIDNINKKYIPMKKNPESPETYKISMDSYLTCKEIIGIPDVR